MSESTTDVCIRVDCLPHATDAEGPVRLVLSTREGTPLAQLSFTPARARDAAFGLSRILGQFIPTEASHRVADGLRTAAIKVWSARN